MVKERVGCATMRNMLEKNGFMGLMFIMTVMEVYVDCRKASLYDVLRTGWYDLIEELPHHAIVVVVLDESASWSQLELGSC